MEFNKIFAAIILALLVAQASFIIGQHLVHPEKLEKNVYVVEGVGEPVASASAEPEVLAPIAPLLASASIADGENVAKRCTACHSFDKGGANRVGPNLWDVVGKGVGKGHPEFAYSTALANHGGSWDYESLNAFLYKPQQFAAGTKMAFAGLKKPEDRAAMIAYLRSLSDAPKPLP